MAASSQSLRAWLLSRLPDGHEAEDVEQEVHLRLWRRAPERFGRWPFSYLLRTARSVLIDRRRARDARPAESAWPDHHELAQPASQGTPELARDPFAHLLALPRHEREVLIGRYREGLSVAQLAERHGVPEGTVKTWAFRGRARLRELLAAAPASPLPPNQGSGPEEHDA